MKRFFPSGQLVHTFHRCLYSVVIKGRSYRWVQTANTHFLMWGFKLVFLFTFKYYLVNVLMMSVSQWSWVPITILVYVWKQESDIQVDLHSSPENHQQTVQSKKDKQNGRIQINACVVSNTSECCCQHLVWKRILSKEEPLHDPLLQCSAIWSSISHWKSSITCLQINVFIIRSYLWKMVLVLSKVIQNTLCI